MMLANNDFSINAKIAGLSKNFNDPADWSDSALRKTQQLHVHHSAVELLDSPEPSGLSAIFRITHAIFFSECCGQLVARWNFHLMLNAIVIRKDNISARPVAEQSDDAWMSSIENPDDTAFGAFPVRPRRHSAEFDLDMISVHCIADGFPRNKYITIELRHRRIRHHEAITVLVQD